MLRLFRMLAVIATIFFLASPAAAASDGASAVVTRLNAGLLEIMRKADELGFQGRVEAFAELLAPVYHLRVMSRASIGLYWRKLNKADKSRLVDAFSRMTYATYARRFTGYTGEHFETTGEKPMVKSLVMVKTNLVKSDGDAIRLDYLTKEYKVGWRIVDVYLEAKYSELARLRAEFTSVLKKDGFEILMVKIEDRIEDAAKEEE